MNDHELLHEFVRSRSQDAFRQLVERHLAMAYSTAGRIVHDSQLAQDVVQEVFTLLAQKAASITPPQIIGGWIYTTTRHQALHAIRGDARRREREQTAVTMQSLQTDSESERILEQLEPVMGELATDERDVLVLRYLENRSLREVGAELGISEDAARMRVNRALERMRTVLASRGVGITSAVLATTLGAATVSAVPVGMATTVTATALVGTVATTTTATSAGVATLHWINVKTMAAVIAAVVIAGGGVYVVQQQQVGRLRIEKQNLAAQQIQLAADNEAAQVAIKSNQTELDRLQKNTGELLRLRNEVSQLRREREAAQLAAVAAKSRPAASDIISANPLGGTNSPFSSLTNLVFEADQQEYIAKPGETNGLFTFRFRNVSSTPVEITGLQPSCSCTLVELPSLPWAIPAGASDVLKATMYFTNKPAGTSYKSLLVVTPLGTKTLLLKVTLPKAVGGSPGPARPYISKVDLTNLGYGTPEDTTQTFAWAIANRNFDALVSAFSPDAGLDESDREDAEEELSKISPLLKGFQIFARKPLGDGEVQLKVKFDYDEMPTGMWQPPPMAVLTLTKLGSIWQVNDQQTYYRAWDEDGQIVTYAQ